MFTTPATWMPSKIEQRHPNGLEQLSQGPGNAKVRIRRERTSGSLVFGAKRDRWKEKRGIPSIHGTAVSEL